MKKLKLIWHEPSNSLAIADMDYDQPLITILDDNVKHISPFYSYPLEWLLRYWDWIEIGEL